MNLKHNYKNKTWICRTCGRGFKARHACITRIPIFCSSKCYGLSIAKFKKCLNCKKTFYNYANKMFCSMLCTGIYKRGKSFSAKHIAALSAAKKGKPQPKYLAKKSVHKKISLALTGKPQPWNQNEKHNLWKGKNAGYTAFHQWLRAKFGRANKCENPNCHYPKKNSKGKIMFAPKAYNWALIHGEKHDHNKENYIQLCCSCHVLYDAGKIEVV